MTYTEQILPERDRVRLHLGVDTIEACSDPRPQLVRMLLRPMLCTYTNERCQHYITATTNAAHLATSQPGAPRQIAACSDRHRPEGGRWCPVLRRASRAQTSWLSLHSVSAIECTLDCIPIDFMKVTFSARNSGVVLFFIDSWPHSRANTVKKLS